jgi:thiol:disulfide interchange protein
MPHGVVSFTFLAATLAATGAQPLYKFDDSSPIVQLGDENFDSLVTADTSHMWVVEYYADWCGHCKAFASG